MTRTKRGRNSFNLRSGAMATIFLIPSVDGVQSHHEAAEYIACCASDTAASKSARWDPGPVSLVQLAGPHPFNVTVQAEKKRNSLNSYVAFDTTYPGKPLSTVIATKQPI